MAARIYKPAPSTIILLAAVLKKGGLVAVPTETVYGLAANALDAKACGKIFAAKGRPANDPLIVHVLNLKAAAQIALLDEAATALAKAFWPGPLTLVLPKTAAVPDIVTSGLDSVALRSPRHPVFRKLLTASGLPLAAPSANPFGYLSPTEAEHVSISLGKKIDHILDGGSCEIGVESTIVDLRNPAKPTILRPGAITAKEISAVLHRRVTVIKPTRGKSPESSPAPGLLSHHYSPRTPLVLHEKIPFSKVSRSRQDQAWVFFHAKPVSDNQNLFSFEAKGQPERAAKNLFSVLRKIDDLGFAKIHVELSPEGGIGDAINDRLRRAAAKS